VPHTALLSDSSRRRFLRGLIVGGTVVVAGRQSAAGASMTTTSDTATAMVWRLNSDWGYPVGSSGAMQCRCNACRTHAANKLFLTADDAMSGRIHPNCRCQPEAIAVPARLLGDLTNIAGGGPSVDRRWAEVSAALAAAVVTAPPVLSTPPASSPQAPSPPQALAHPSEGAKPATDTPGELAFTGTNARPLETAGLAALAVGAIAVCASHSHRSTEPPAAD